MGEKKIWTFDREESYFSSYFDKFKLPRPRPAKIGSSKKPKRPFKFGVFSIVLILLGAAILIVDFGFYDLDSLTGLAVKDDVEESVNEEITVSEESPVRCFEEDCLTICETVTEINVVPENSLTPDMVGCVCENGDSEVIEGEDLGVQEEGCVF